jgi:geranylgeranyl diphosphate synthase type I
MTRHAVRPTVPAALDRIRTLVEPAAQRAVDWLDDPQMRLISRYQMGWCDAQGEPTHSGGKAIRPTLAVLSAEAVIGRPDEAIPMAIAVELVHNFSLLHDDVMDRDLERRHRPTAWVAFGEGQAILAGTAMLTLAVRLLTASGLSGRRALGCLLDTVQVLISGQSQDLLLEQAESVTMAQVLSMEAGKTAALLACSSSIGALAVGAPEQTVSGLAQFGYELGLAFQLVDDVLGVVGDPAQTGKSSSSDVRAGKRSAPIAAALTSNTPAGERLAEMFASGPPAGEAEVELATKLIIDSGGLDWATNEAQTRLDAAMEQLHALELIESPAAELEAIANYIVNRDR